MSGTSLDGVDVALANIDQLGVVQHASYSHPMPAALKEQVLAICQGQLTTLANVGELDLKLGILFAEAVLGLLAQQQLKAEQIIAIGCHGQTVWHAPQGLYPFTMQLGDNNRLVAMTGITTVGDFRRRDMVYGGQGAPLVPAFHQALLFNSQERRAVLNIGGITNLSLLYPGLPVRGFDCGPGNMLMDTWIWHHRQQSYDKDAEWALVGRVNQPLLTQMLTDSYFSLPPPKSSGREHFNWQWLEQQLSRLPEIAPVDVQATLAELTAVTIADCLTQFGDCQRLLVCGGGAHNPLVMSRLAALLPATAVASTDEFGVSGDDMEALAFAWLAARTLAGQAGNLPAVTGAAQETILGAIYPLTS